ncbi:unnamed protein product [Sphenostylis stenocarpa]|uniref:Wound-responsive family protein n=1 Tax=Sphenostylis stenocarpa TaxID=92480 RepID=A0AA86SZC8_9FABA|nr:unnamed protein product [Sphenostylis stenocarpa]
MSRATSKAWIAAASVGAVEALKDQLGVCRWNHGLRCVQQHMKNHVRSFSQAKNFSSSSAVAASKLKGEKAKKAEESFRTVLKNIERITVRSTSLEMSAPKRTWTVAVTVGVVETLKDQGLCRWNSGFKSAQQSVKSHVGSLSQAKKLSSASSAMVSGRMHEEKAEESLRSVMYLSCWGPN